LQAKKRGKKKVPLPGKKFCHKERKKKKKPNKEKKKKPKKKKKKIKKKKESPQKKIYRWSGKEKRPSSTKNFIGVSVGGGKKLFKKGKKGYLSLSLTFPTGAKRFCRIRLSATNAKTAARPR